MAIRTRALMGIWLIALVGVIYLVASVDLFIRGETGLGLFCLGCVIANFGLVVAGS